MTRLARGYAATSTKLGIPYQRHCVGNCSKIARPVNSCAPVKTRALNGDTAPRAIGRRRVRATCGSRLRSHRSLIVHPAPRMMRAPLKKSIEVPMTDKGEVNGSVYGAARSVEKRHGKKR